MEEQPKRRTDAELKARSLSRWENEGGASAKGIVNGWLIAVVYLGGGNDARGIAERWAASFDNPQTALAAVAKESGGSSPKVVRRLDPDELASVGITKVGMVGPFRPER
jgi:hypothetical protein